MKTSSKKKKIIYCISSLNKAGGMERVLTNKANYFAKNGFAITVITTDQKQRKNYFELEPTIECIDLGINYEDLNGKGILYKLRSYPQKQRLHRRRLEETLMRLRADITISLFDHDVSFLWCIKDGSCKLLESHFSRFKRLQYGKKGIWGLINKYRSTLDLKYIEKYKRFIVLTKEDYCYWGSLNNMVVIPNANSFHSSHQATLDEKVVVAVGRFDYQKQFEHLIQVWSHVAADFPDWRLEIYGQGGLQDDLQDCIDRLHLREQISLYRPVQDIKQVYLHSSMIAMTSRYEGLPMALLEAQVFGLPMVSYACKCGPKDIIESERNGFLIEEGNMADFAEKLKLLMGNDILRHEMGREAKLMSRRFSEVRVMKQWLNLFKEVQKQA